MNSIERWKKSFLTLPDGSFFDLLRNYLGELKTPFNKQSLLGRLETMLRRPETRRRIVALVDTEDALILAASALLAGPTIGSLAGIFEADWDFFNLHRRLLNLQDRLLLYVEKQADEERIHVNPLLVDDLKAAGLLEPGVLFPALPAPAPTGDPWLCDGLLAALLCFVLENPGMRRSDGSLRKRVEAELGRTIPCLAERSRGETLLRALGVLGLLTEEEPRPDMETWKAFARFSRRRRELLVWSGACSPDLKTAWRLAEFLVSFLSSLPLGMAFPSSALVRMSRILTCPVPAPELIRTLIAFQALVPAGPEDHLMKHPACERQAEQAAAAPLIVSPACEISARPDLDLEGGVFLACTASLRRYDVYARYELTRASYIRARGFDYGASDIRTSLERLTGKELPQNIRFSLDHWESEFSAFGLYRGVVAVVREEHRSVFEHHHEFKKLIREVLAPGVYLFPADAEREMRGLFQKVGLLAETQMREYSRRADLRRPRSFPDRFDPPELFGLFLDQAPETESTVDRTFLAELEALVEAPDYPQEQRTPARDLLERRLLLFPEQLEAGTGRGVKSEARGIDFSGKVRIIEQVLQHPTDVLEIIFRAPGGSPRRYLIRPADVRRTGSELVLEGTALPGGEQARLAIGKMSLVRRVRGSFSA